MKEYVCIKVFQNEYRAAVVKEKLAAYKIVAIVVNGDAGGLYPLPEGLERGVQILVDKKEAKRATELLKYIEA